MSGANHPTPDEQTGMQTGKTERGVREREAHDHRQPTSNEIAKQLRENAKWFKDSAVGACLIVGADEIERLTRERDEALSLNNELARARKIDGSERWARLCGDWNRQCGEVTAERDALIARVAELEKERDNLRVVAREAHAQLQRAARGSLKLNNALGRILDVRPLGVETYPECYSIMRTIALNALSAASSSTGATP